MDLKDPSSSVTASLLEPSTTGWIFLTENVQMQDKSEIAFFIEVAVHSNIDGCQ